MMAAFHSSSLEAEARARVGTATVTTAAGTSQSMGCVVRACEKQSQTLDADTRVGGSSTRLQGFTRPKHVCRQAPHDAQHLAASSIVMTEEGGLDQAVVDVVAGLTDDAAEDPAQIQHHTLKYHLLGPSLTKAGQDAVDQQKVVAPQ